MAHLYDCEFHSPTGVPGRGATIGHGSPGNCREDVQSSSSRARTPGSALLRGFGEPRFALFSRPVYLSYRRVIFFLRCGSRDLIFSRGCRCAHAVCNAPYLIMYYGLLRSASFVPGRVVLRGDGVAIAIGRSSHDVVPSSCMGESVHSSTPRSTPYRQLVCCPFSSCFLDSAACLTLSQPHPPRARHYRTGFCCFSTTC